MSKTIIYWSLVSALLLTSSLPLKAAETFRERISFDADWRFEKDDPSGVGESLDYATLKPWLLPTANHLLGAFQPVAQRPSGAEPGGDVSYVRPDFDDSAWRKINLPHDWAIEGPFSYKLPGETGKLPWTGVGWYRKTFTVPATDAGRRLYLDLDGAMAYASVWLNGKFVGGWPYGYASWRVDLTPYAKPGAENVLAIRLHNPPDSSRWYPGSGIYRHVWLVKTAPIHVEQWGVRILTPQVSAKETEVYIETTFRNHTDAPAKVEVASKIFALDANGIRLEPAIAAGLPIANVSVVEPGRTGLVAQPLTIVQPKFWSVAAPHRYVAVTTVTQGGLTLDVVETPFGVRTFEFTADRGFMLNGKHLPLQGVCLHHDLGALGAAINERAMERQLQILKEMGCNAIRTSHNPPAPEFLDLCDRLGFLVMDEIFDCWKNGKKRNDYNVLFRDWHEADLRALIRRDRNHPSVVLWSLGNEVYEQRISDGWQVAAHLAGLVRQEDRTRPVTAGLHRLPSYYNGFQAVLDVMGFNYKPNEYLKFRKANPHVPVLSSESTSTISSRGEYFFPIGDIKKSQVNFQVSSYDLTATSWSSPAEAEFLGLDRAPFVAGEFVWTGFDYLGEPWPYGGDSAVLLNFTDPEEIARHAREFEERGKLRVPSRSSYFGIIDLAGFKKDRFYLYQSRWRPDLPMAHILPHWTWPERVGQLTPVHVYTSGDEAELFLNGRSLGRKKRGAEEYRLRWDDVVYTPGELRVVTFKGGAEWATEVTRTAGDPAKLMMTADRSVLNASGSDLAFITARVEDASGTLVPRASHRIKFEVTGPADLIATDNGDPTSFESFQSAERAAFNGLALAIIRPHPGAGGTIAVRATSGGLANAEVKLTRGPQ
jgi:beta-galactosidase